ncbi:MAG TPA: hypothetical protein VGE08_16580 [Steroidobacter sp.]
MNDRRMMEEIEIDELEMIDFGNAARETRNFHPAQVIVDNSFQLGILFFQ